MRPTRLGISVLFAAGLSFFGAFLSGNNLLYLLTGFLAAALAVAAALNSRQAAGLGLGLAAPDQAFQDAPFLLAFEARNRRRRPLYQIDVVVPGSRHSIAFLPRGGIVRFELPYRLSRRGLNRPGDIAVESIFPYGLFRSVKKAEARELLAFPRVFEIYGPPVSAAAREESIALPRRGVGDDFHGLREYVRGEDSRLINWKLTARTGKPLVKEYAHAAGRRVVVTVLGAPGPGAEERIAEAASLAKFHIDSGAEVKLVTDEGEVPFGKGLLQLQLLLEKLALLGEGKELRSTPPLARGRPGKPSALQAALLTSVYLTTAAAFGSLFLIEELSPVFLALAALIIPVGLLFDLKKSYPLPKKALDLASVFVLGFAFFVDFRTAGLVRTVTHILLFVVAYFLWTPKTERTLRRILLTDFLIFFLASGQAVDLAYLPFFAAFFLAAGFWLVRWCDPGGPRPRRPGWARGVLAVGIRGFAVAAALFLVFPRAYSPRMQQLLASAGLSRFQNPQFSFAGLTDRVDLGFFGPLRKNSARVMRVSFIRAPEGFRPPASIRVRAGAFDFFTGRRWARTSGDFEVRTGERFQRSRGGLFRLRNRGGLIVFPGFDEEKPSIVEEIFVYPMISAFIFGAGGLGAVETDAYAASFDDNDSAFFPSLYGSAKRYRIRTQAETPAFYREIRDYPALLRERFLGLVRPQPRWRQFAEARTGAFASPFEKAKALESYLRTRYSYSLAAADNRQDLDAFLWDSKAGNCEYFASAMVLLLRHLGIPSRLAVGFLSEDWNDYGAFFDVRQSDAHAWVEAFFPDRGWVPFDPTPPGWESGEGRGLLAVLWHRLDQFVGAVEARWYRYVVGFDSETQKDLLQSLRFRFSRNPLIWAIGLAGGAALAAIFVLLKRRGRRGSRAGRSRKADDFYAAALRALARSGYPRPDWQTGREFASGVVRERPDLAPFQSLTDHHYEVRYGGRSISPDESRDIQALAGRLREALRRSRRTIGSRRANPRPVS